MLRMQVVRTAGVPYYVRDLVPGTAEGTGVAGESLGVWSGRGSAVLGVRGVVRTDDFTSVFAGRDPVGERPLRTAGGARAVAGVDLLFGAPKAVSLLHLLGPRELAEATGVAHEAAVADAVGYLERVGLGVRRTRGGVTRRLPATGAVAAGFVHRTSRALDPHVHTHFVAANIAQGVDGVWSAVDTRRLFLHRRCVEAVYDTSLRWHLTERLGVAWERGHAGRWAVVGVDPVLTRLFSQRTASIDEHAHRATGGRGSAARRRVAFHVDRPDKDAGPTVEDLRAAWRRRAADHDLDPADLVQVVGRSRAVPGEAAVDRDVLSEQLAVLANRGATLGTRDLVAAVAESSPYGLAPADLDTVVEALGRDIPTAGPRLLEDRGEGFGVQDPRRWATGDVVRACNGPSDQLAAVLSDPAGSRQRMLGGVGSRVDARGRPTARERGADRGLGRVPGHDRSGVGSGSSASDRGLRR